MAQSSLATPPRVVNPTRRSCGGFQAGRIHIVPSWASASTVPQHPATGSSHSVGGRSLVAAAFVAGAPVAARARRRIYGSCCRGAVPLARDEKVLGIDLGTTTSVVATVDAGCPEVLPNAEGSLGTPSVVAYTKDGEILVGEVAKRQAILNPRCTFHSVKRFIGRSMSEAITDAASVPYSVQDVDGRIMLGCPNLERSIHPEEVSAEVLKKLKTDASNFLEARVDKAVISVPAYFNDCQRQATKDAARIAGLEVLRIANEPTMAAFAYGLERRNAQTLLVADLGGGTLDVSILQTGDGVSEVLRTGGDSQLGGRDFDGRIWTWLSDRFEEEHGIDLRQDAQALQRLIEASEKAKIELSTVEEVEISLPYVALGEDGPLHLTEVLTRKHFEDLCSDLWHRCREPISKTIAETVNYRFLTQSVLVGGGSRMPAFQELVKEVTANKPINSAISPEDAVAVGCALQAAMICGEVEDLLLIDVTPLTLGVETAGGVVTPVVELNTAIPFKKSKIFTTSEDCQDEIEVKVYQGERIMAEDNKLLGSFRLLDIAPAPAGIPKIQVIFEIDLNGILTVTAYDWATRQTKSVVIKDASTMEPWEVDRLLEEADRAQVDDDVKSQQAQLLEDSRLLIKISEEKLAELASKIPDEMAYEVLPRVAELQVALEDDPIDFDRLKVSCEAVRYQMMLVGQRAYGKPVLAGGIPGPRAPRPPGGTAAGGSMPRGPIFTEEAEDASPQDTSPAGKDMRGKQAAVKKALDTWRRGQ